MFFIFQDQWRTDSSTYQTKTDKTTWKIMTKLQMNIVSAYFNAVIIISMNLILIVCERLSLYMSLVASPSGWSLPGFCSSMKFLYYHLRPSLKRDEFCALLYFSNVDVFVWWYVSLLTNETFAVLSRNRQRLWRQTSMFC